MRRSVWSVICLAVCLFLLSISSPAHSARPGEIWTEPVTGMEFVWVPGGCFMMGQSDAEKAWILKEAGEEWYKKRFNDESPRHEVCVDGFWMGRYEVTRGQFRKFAQATGYKTDAEKGGDAWGLDANNCAWQKNKGANWQNPGFSQDDSHPVVDVSWNDAKAFAQWASGKGTLRLPTEAEWEYAARGGSKGIWFWGDDPGQICGHANIADRQLVNVWGNCKFSYSGPAGCDDGYPFTAPVGKYWPNDFGLHDMIGNVWEWCEDWYDSQAYASHAKKNPISNNHASGSRVARGGSWFDIPVSARAAIRGGGAPDDRSSDYGFRLVRLPQE